MENLPQALQLLLVGMLTVFVILLVVIYLGKELIFFINKFAPEEKVVKKTVSAPSASTVDANTQAIIRAAVSQLTGGKGTASKIQKV